VFAPAHTHEGSGRTHSTNRLSIHTRLPVAVTSVRHQTINPDWRRELREAQEVIASGHFSRGDREAFQPLVENLLHADPFLVLADYADYVARQEDVSTASQDAPRWTSMSIEHRVCG